MSITRHGVAALSLLALSFKVGCGESNNTESLRALMLWDGLPIQAELHQQLRYGLFNPWKNQKYRLTQIRPWRGDSPLAKYPESVQMVVKNGDRIRGPAYEAMALIASAYPEGDPMEEIGVLLSIEPLEVAIIARHCVGGAYEHFGTADGSIVAGMVAAAGPFTEEFDLGFTFASEDSLHCDAHVLITTDGQGRAHRSSIRSTLRELLVRHR